MGAFTPFKRNANKFNYKPRFYDPAKEAREQRRAEMRGKRSDSKEEYKPGSYIRNQSAARSARRSEDSSKSRSKMWMLILAVIALAYMGTMLYNKLVAIFIPAEQGIEQGLAPKTTLERNAMREYEEFDPYAPITVVPNDYQPEK